MPLPRSPPTVSTSMPPNDNKSFPKKQTTTRTTTRTPRERQSAPARAPAGARAVPARAVQPGGGAAPLAVQNAFAGALQQPVVAGGNAPISRELAERCLGEMRQDKSTIARLEGQLAVAAADRAALADRESQLDAQFAAAVADRATIRGPRAASHAQRPPVSAPAPRRPSAAAACTSR